MTAFRIASRPWKRSVAPVRDRKYLAFVRTQPCAVCGSWRWVESAHTGGRGLTQKADDRKAIPLCRFHHQRSTQSLHALGPTKFARVWKLDVRGLILELQGMYPGELVL
jgi:hypothetical protein